MTTKRRFVQCAAFLRAVIPLLLLGVTYLRSKQEYNVHSDAVFQGLMVLFWPSSLLLLANDGARPNQLGPYIVVLISIAVNIVIYAFLAFCISFAARKITCIFGSSSLKP